MRLLAFAAASFFSTLSFAAPQADTRKIEGWSRMDEFRAFHPVQKSAAPRELKRAAPSPELDAMLDAFLDANANTGLLVLRGDTILAERYQYARTERHRFASASVAKTVLGMLVGIAVSENKLSLDEKAEAYLPELKGHPYGGTTIRQLLTMSSGIDFTETYATRDEGTKLVANTLDRKTEGGVATVLEFRRRAAPAGTRFHYSSADSEVLGLVLIAAVKRPLAEYLAEKIWQPMGAEADATWLVDKGGYETGFCCINATLRDFARFGLLLARYGELDGKQIIPAGWVKAATTPEAPHLQVGKATPNNGYGYQTWITSRGEPPHLPRFAALGLFGQAVYVDAASRLVVVHTAVWADGNDRAARGAQFRLWENLLARYSQ